MKKSRNCRHTEKIKAGKNERRAAKRAANVEYRDMAEREITARYSYGIVYTCPKCHQQFMDSIRTRELAHLDPDRVSSFKSPPRKCPLCNMEIDIRKQAPKTDDEAKARIKEAAAEREAKRAASLARRRSMRESKSKK